MSELVKRVTRPFRWFHRCTCSPVHGCYPTRYRTSQRTVMPTAMVSTALCLHQATPPATSAAITLALPGSMRSIPGAMNTTAGTTIAVSIATGTCLSAWARSGGMSRFAKSAMNDSRAVYVIAPTAKISNQIVSSLSTLAHHLVTEHAGRNTQQPGADHRQSQRHRVERDDRDRRDRKDQNRNVIPKERHQHREKTQRHDELELP